VWGLIEPSRDGYRYYVSFLDNHSRFAAVYFLRRKNEVYEKFRAYEAWFRNQFGGTIKVFRSDQGGGEYQSTDMKRFMADQGIQPMPSTPYTPEQNPVAEQFNRSLMEETRALLEHAGLSLSFWVDAAMVMVFILQSISEAAIGESISLRGALWQETRS
jgi:transposase InsO family protein